MNLSARRKACGATQIELAKYCGVTEQTISKWEREAMRPNAENQAKIEKFFEEREKC